jgi:hypothetical protein
VFLYLAEGCQKAGTRGSGSADGGGERPPRRTALETEGQRSGLDLSLELGAVSERPKASDDNGKRTEEEDG